MILSELTLRNFCIYRGEHRFDLTPGVERGRPKPVVLFGGINGGGKTTILDAVQLVLYGKRAKCSKRGDKSYEEFLKSCINHDASPEDGAAVSLAFRYASEGSEHDYEITRSWSDTAGGTTRERIIVLKDGERDGWMSDNWNQLVEDLIPFGVAQLCFFDAEKIRFLAEDETTNRSLGEAIKSLLGLDLAERLLADAQVLEGRIAHRLQNSEQIQHLNDLEEQREAAQGTVEQLKQTRAGLSSNLERAEESVRKAERNFEQVGGRHWKQREQRQQEHGQLKAEVTHSEQALVTLASGSLPLCLIQDLLRQVRDQAATERAGDEAERIAVLLESRDTALMNHLSCTNAADDVLSQVETFLNQDRQDRAANPVESWLNLPDVSARRLNELLRTELKQIADTVSDRLGTLNDARRDLDSVRRSLAAAPKDEAVKEVAEELKKASAEVAELKTKLARIDRELAAATFERDELDKKIRTLNRKHIDAKISSDENARIGALVAKTRTTMQEFLKRATSRKIQHLSELVTTSFRFLLHKQSLVEQVVIDPDTFGISLVDATCRVLPKDKLSEGEKQIFAISVLWGLSQASARPLPAIIDTPMGRLDAEHRSQLVQRYFPHASHQVIILSTDTEIEVEYFEQLQPSIARAYHLNYSETDRSTHAEEGYFWGRSLVEEFAS